ncbi:hypothetical protein ACLOJK_034058 [Asimina triloba]
MGKIWEAGCNSRLNDCANVRGALAGGPHIDVFMRDVDDYLLAFSSMSVAVHHAFVNRDSLLKG